MATAIKTLKIPFLALNASKQALFKELQDFNTAIANQILRMPKDERKALTTKAFRDVPIGSAWMNQTIRNVNAKTKVKQFKTLPLETNNQNWTLHKVGDTFSLSFGLQRGIRKRVPLAIHQANHVDWLEDILNGTVKPGSLKLWRSRKGLWYALISASREVPEATPVDTFMGIDRGQNIPAVGALPDSGFGLFFKANRIKHLRRNFANRRRKLQSQGKLRAVKKLGSRERRIITHINHRLAKEIVRCAKRAGCGLRLEDLSGLRQTMKQRKKTKSDAGQNRDYWPFYQLEQFIQYKAQLAGVQVEKVPAPYTSKTHFDCGHIGQRKGFNFYCPHCDKHEHADLNAARNIGGWEGLFCAVDPSPVEAVIASADLPYAVDDSPLNCVSEASPIGLVE